MPYNESKPIFNQECIPVSVEDLPPSIQAYFESKPNFDKNQPVKLHFTYPVLLLKNKTVDRYAESCILHCTDIRISQGRYHKKYANVYGLWRSPLRNILMDWFKKNEFENHEKISYAQELTPGKFDLHFYCKQCGEFTDTQVKGGLVCKYRHFESEYLAYTKLVDEISNQVMSFHTSPNP
jgi:hypothetical protein